MSARNDKPPVQTRHGEITESFRRDDVEDFQRARIISAMIEVASELGYLGAAIAPVVARAGVSRRTFYELFDGREECFLATFEWGAGQMRGVMVEAFRSQRSWRDRVRHALAALLHLLDSEPELARVCVIEALGAGKLVLQRRSQLLDELVGMLDADAPRARGVTGLPLLTAEGVIGGAFSVVHGRLLEQGMAKAAGEAGQSSNPTTSGDEGLGGGRRLIDLHGQLMALVALPYLGPRAAGEELTRSPPEVSQPPAVKALGGGKLLLERLDMRLTYRTMRCLTFIAQHPGASNREIAEGAEIPDEGQASKLLGRLVTFDLIANSKSHGPGYPNCWTLTTHGEQVLSVVRGR